MLSLRDLQPSLDRSLGHELNHLDAMVPHPTCQVFFHPFVQYQIFEGQTPNLVTVVKSITLLLEKILSPKPTLPCEKGPSQKENHLPTAIFQSVCC